MRARVAVWVAALLAACSDVNVVPLGELPQGSDASGDAGAVAARDGLERANAASRTTDSAKDDVGSLGSAPDDASAGTGTVADSDGGAVPMVAAPAGPRDVDAQLDESDDADDEVDETEVDAGRLADDADDEADDGDGADDGADS